MSRALRVIIDNQPVLINIANIAKVTLDGSIIKLRYIQSPDGFFGTLIVGSGYVSSNRQVEILEAATKEEAKEIFDKIEKLM
jgi:hypothetical protein